MGESDPWGASWRQAQEDLQLKQIPCGGWVSECDCGEPFLGSPRISVTAQEGEILRERARGLRVLEIGTGLGVSTRYLAESALWVLSVDVDPWVWRLVWPGLGPLGNVLLAGAVPTGGFMVDMAFVDGCHHYDDVLADLRSASALQIPSGLLALHDANYDPVRLAAATLGLDLTIEKTHNWLAYAKLKCLSCFACS